jgi:dTDP-L-rhamnose 4-epimerase
LNVLVTGGAGFIGSHVVDMLLDRGDRVVVLDSLDPQVHGASRSWPEWSLAAKRRGATLHRVELPDLDEVKRILDVHEIEAVIHLAARVGVGQSAYEVASYTQANVLGTASLLDSIRTRGDKIKRVVVAGSMSCYGEGAVRTARGIMPGWDRARSDLAAGRWQNFDPWDVRPGEDGGGAKVVSVPTSEEIPLRCTSVYAETKRAQEELTRLVCGTSGTSWAVARFFNTYGPRQSLANPYTGIAAIFSSRILNGLRPIVFEDGRQTRDFVFVEDVARAVIALLDTPEAVGTFNVGTGHATVVGDLATLLADLLGRPVIRPLYEETFRVGDIRACVADTERMTRATGWTAEVRLPDGLRRLCDWARDQQTPPDGLPAALRELTARGLVR